MQHMLSKVRKLEISKENEEQSKDGTERLLLQAMCYAGIRDLWRGGFQSGAIHQT